MARQFPTVCTPQLSAARPLDPRSGGGDFSLAPRGLAKQGFGSLPLQHVARGAQAARVW